MTKKKGDPFRGERPALGHLTKKPETCEHALAMDGPAKAFRIYGPTCDTLDVLPRPLMLPENIAAGDFVVFESIGAYSIALRTNFNGFYPDNWAIVGN